MPIHLQKSYAPYSQQPLVTKKPRAVELVNKVESSLYIIIVIPCNNMYTLAADMLLLTVSLTSDRPVFSSDKAPHMD
jgi:glutamate racemase